MSEQACGLTHHSIDEALAHAHQNLTADGSVVSEPYWGKRGGRIANVGHVIGYQSADGSKRYRLDYDETKGVHVNEEDFNRPTAKQKVLHKVEPSATPMDDDAATAWKKIAEGRMQTYWRKWTGRYDKPPDVLEAEHEVDRRRRES
jgi:hypothetical protein